MRNRYSKSRLELIVQLKIRTSYEKVYLYDTLFGMLGFNYLM